MYSTESVCVYMQLMQYLRNRRYPGKRHQIVANAVGADCSLKLLHCWHDDVVKPSEKIVGIHYVAYMCYLQYKQCIQTVQAFVPA